MPIIMPIFSRATGIFDIGNIIGPERHLYTLPPWESTTTKYLEADMKEDGGVYNDLNALSEEPTRAESVIITNV